MIFPCQFRRCRGPTWLHCEGRHFFFFLLLLEKGPFSQLLVPFCFDAPSPCVPSCSAEHHPLPKAKAISSGQADQALAGLLGLEFGVGKSEMDGLFVNNKGQQERTNERTDKLTACSCDTHFLFSSRLVGRESNIAAAKPTRFVLVISIADSVTADQCCRPLTRGSLGNAHTIPQYTAQHTCYEAVAQHQRKQAYRHG